MPLGLQAPCCGKLYPCRLCHDGAEEHRLDRFRVAEVQCSRCRLLQKVGAGAGRGGGRRHGGDRGGGRRRHLEPRTSPPLPPVWRSPQAQQRCEGCQSLFGEYYCGVCHLFDRDKKQYHCDDCGICRCGTHG